MIHKLRQGIGGLFYGWRMVAVGCAIRMLGGGFHLYGFTIFFLPITQELGLSRAATSLVFCLARAEGAIEGPLASYLIDRLGPRPMIDARWRLLFCLRKERMVALGIRHTLYVHGGDFFGGLGDRGRLLRPKVIRNHPGHHELLLPLGTCVGPRHYRCDLRSLSQLCSNDVSFHHSRPDR